MNETESAPGTGFPDPNGDLARYNAEVYRGIQHTPEQDAAMAEAQRRYNQWMRAHETVPLNWWNTFRARHGFRSYRVKYVQRPSIPDNQENTQ